MIFELHGASLERAVPRALAFLSSARIFLLLHILTQPACVCVCLVTSQVTVQAGCRVQQVADALKPHGLTLQNYASIREQQIGGFIQVSA